MTELTPDEWTFHFLDLRTKQTYCIQVRRTNPVEVLKSCGEEIPSQLAQFKLVDYAAYGEVNRLDQ